MVVMRYHLSGDVALKVSERPQNDLIILPVVLHCRHVRGVRGWDYCESFPFHISQNMSQL